MNRHQGAPGLPLWPRVLRPEGSNQCPASERGFIPLIHGLPGLWNRCADAAPRGTRAPTFKRHQRRCRRRGLAPASFLTQVDGKAPGACAQRGFAHSAASTGLCGRQARQHGRCVRSFFLRPSGRPATAAPGARTNAPGTRTPGVGCDQMLHS